MMDKETREKLIKEKEAELKRLRDEIKDLKAPTSIGGLTKNYMHVVDVDGKHFERRPFVTKNGKEIKAKPAEWQGIRDLCMEAFRRRYGVPYHATLKVKDMEEEDVRLCAQMADEIIGIWNEYVEKLYTEKGCEETQ